jgi:TetR/AcrR family transcriptional regulator, transcriptional repressor for nem operon
MPRPREFDTATVLNQAMRLFWRKGYVATSMADIYQATGLKPGNLYAAFKDKEGLFQQAFEQYAAYFHSTLPKDSTGLAAIADWLNLQAKLAINDKNRAGCLIVNTVAEREAHSPATQAMAQGRMREIRDFFVKHLTLAVHDGTLRNHTDIDMHADALVGAVVAIMTLGRAGADGATIAHVAKAALSALNIDQSIKNYN